jgi:hypothetical protein
MASTLKNTIQKNFIELNFNGQTDAFELQQQVGEWCQETLLPQLETVFEELGLPDYQQKIDRLDIELNLNASRHWKIELTEQVLEQIRKLLARELEKKKKEVFSARPSSFVELLLHYFQKGFLPWWTPIKNQEEFLASYREWSQSLVLSQLERATLVTAFSEQRAVENALQSLPSELLDHLIGQLLPFAKQEWPAILHDIHLLTNIRSAYPQNKRQKETAWRKALLKAIGLAQSQRDEKIAELALKEWLKAENISISGQQALAVTSTLFRTWQKRLSKTKELFKAHDSSPTNSVSEVAISVEDETQREEIYLQNAGIVLLHPFLSMLFERLNVLRGWEIAQPGKALRLLHYLGTGNEGPAPFELVLSKLLCGIPFAQAVDLGELLTEEDKREADELLTSAIEHWSILKDTSSEGLREAFLRREGKLTFEAKEWRLLVEKRGIDVLLDHLPWNIQLIKLPWMERLLRIEWN